MRANARIEGVGEILDGATDHETGERLLVAGHCGRLPQRRHRQGGTGGIVGVVTGNELRPEGGVEHVAREHADVIE